MLRLLFIAWLIIGPVIFLTVSRSQDRILNDLITASQKNDAQAISDRVDWVALRENLKEHLKSQKQTLGNYGTAIGPAMSDIDKVVDYYVQPENIALAFYFHDTLFPNIKEEDFIRSQGFEPVLGFQITLGYPDNAPHSTEMAPVLKDRLKAKFIFRLDGLTWKIEDMELPIFMVPRRTHSRPATEIFMP